VGLSVPVLIDQKRTAALSIRFAETALPVKDAVARFIPLLHAVAAKVTEHAHDTAEPRNARRAESAEATRLS
jgi:hypothetical protein